MAAAGGRPSAEPKRSTHGRPFALQNIRILDFSWFLASAGGTRFLAALGAECIKVEWKENPDTRLAAMAPVGGRAARDSATAPLPGVDDADMGGQFNNKNAGKRGLSLNIRHPKGLDIAKRLVALSRRRGGRVFARRARAPRPRLRGAEGDTAGHHLRAAIGDGQPGHLWAAPDRRADRRGVCGNERDVGPARAGDAGRLGLLLPRLDGCLWLRSGDPRRALPSGAHRRGATDRCFAMRSRHFPLRPGHPRLVGQWPGVDAGRQPFARSPRRAARCLSLPR